jgi:hypothetical protein
MRSEAIVILASLGLVATPLATSAQCSSPYWQQLFPAQSPTGTYRQHHAMVYDSRRGVTILYGGNDSGNILGDTWEFDSLTWRQIVPQNPPLPLDLHAMSYDLVTRKTVMFGGVAGIVNNPASAITYEYDGSDWHEVSLNSGYPEGRYDHKMVYDTARGKHVLYGGFVCRVDPGAGFCTFRPVSETWEFDSNARTWTLRSTSGPPRRFEFGLAYDSTCNQAVLFGGMLQDTTGVASYGNDTWVWNGGSGTWTQMVPAHRPAGRREFAMTFDKVRNVVVLLGGIMPDVISPDGTSWSEKYTKETWEWNGTDWTDKTSQYNFGTNAVPSALVYETARQQVLMFDAIHSNSSPTPNKTYALATGNGRNLNYVDWNNFFIEDGSPFFPYRTLAHAIPCTLGAATISMRGGDYPEGPTTINKQVRIIANNGSAHIH